MPNYAQVNQEKMAERKLLPELRLVAYDDQGRAIPAVSISGDFIDTVEIEGNTETLRRSLEALVTLFCAHVGLRNAGGRWALPDNHNNDPHLPLVRQLLAVIESGKAGYNCMTFDDATNPNRRYLLIRVDKKPKG